MQVDVRATALDTCLKAKVGLGPGTRLQGHVGLGVQLESWEHPHRFLSLSHGPGCQLRASLETRDKELQNTPVRPGSVVLSSVLCPSLGQVTYFTYQQYIAAIILSEKQCQDNLKESNRSCEGECGQRGVGTGDGGTGISWPDPPNPLGSAHPVPPALILKLGEKSKTLELELVKEKAMCAQDKDGLGTAKRMAEGQLAECIKVQELLRQEQQLGQQQLQKVQALCLQLDKDKFEADLRSLWRDSIIPRSLDSLGFGYHPLGSELSSIRRSCDLMPSLMASKVEELVRSLRSGVERVARENTDLQRQKLEVERGLRASEEAKAKAEKEAQAREAKLQAECARQTQLALEEKAALRRERDSLAKELEGKKREVEQLKMQVDVRATALDTCLKAKVGLGPRMRVQGHVGLGVQLEFGGRPRSDDEPEFGVGSSPLGWVVRVP
jgi:hypothetical protein